jgi:alpha-1,6-mannosyltransferase
VPLGEAILLGALLLRLPLLPLPPALSGDALRYLWDGKVAAAGFNPYALPPAAEELTPLHDAAWRRLPHSQVPTVYPPLSVAAFSIASRLPFPLLAWKLMATAADLLGCWLLLAVARRRGLPEGRAVWYAWNPLAALEVAGMGHVDVLGVAAVVGAVLCLLPRSGPSRSVGAAAILATAGALAKLVPSAALPMWSRQSGRPWRFLGIAGGLVVLAVLPVLAATGGVPPGLVAYAVSWEFNGPLFEPLWRLLDAAGAAPALARGLDRLKEWTGEYEAWNPIYPYLYPQLLAKLALAAAAGAAVLLSLRERDPVAGTGRLFGRLLLLSATVYPWYLLWVLPWAALRRHTAWLALSGLVLLSYIPQFSSVPLWPWVYLAVWGPFAVLGLVERLRTLPPPEPSPPDPLSRPLPSPLTGRGGGNSEKGETAGRLRSLIWLRSLILAFLPSLPEGGREGAGEGPGVRVRVGEPEA